jgi:mono/diheme cytochrome c family protein
MGGLRNKNKAIVLILCLSIILFSIVNLSHGDDKGNIDLGKHVYNIRCALCHGSNGDGKGMVGVIRRMETSGREQIIFPWDLTQGVFRFRSTPSGCLPDDEDLLGTISNGIPVSLMPSHDHIPSEEKKALVQYLKTFSDRWEEEEDEEEDESCAPFIVKKPDWVGSDVSIKKGEIIYKKMKCWECHGDEGTGDGAKAADLKDDWGRTMLPFDFTSGDLKRGSSPDNVYITFSSGLDGTSMPSYADSLNEEERWHLVSYTLKLMKKVK